MVLTDVLAGWPGSVHDSRVLRNSSLYATSANKFPCDYHRIGNGGYPLLRWYTQKCYFFHKGSTYNCIKKLSKVSTLKLEMIAIFVDWRKRTHPLMRILNCQLVLSKWSELNVMFSFNILTLFKASMFLNLNVWNKHNILIEIWSAYIYLMMAVLFLIV